MNAGTLIGGRYRLVRRIGAGGMGEVWEAKHEVTAKPVALKVLNATYSAHAEVRARFLLEARAACRVRHPNVVQVHDVLELADGAPAMVMDLLQGESLGAKLQRCRTIGVSELAFVLTQAVEAMSAAHALGIVHRDLKPDNLFLERQADGKTVVKVLDFGIAKVVPHAGDRDVAALTSTGAVLGTPYYMSPEQAFGEKDLDHRADIWSLGIIMFECLAGVRPTEAENIGQIFKMLSTGAMPRLAQMAPHVPADVADLVTRMLSTDRRTRPTLGDVFVVLSRHAADPRTGIVSTPPLAVTIPQLAATMPQLAESAAPVDISNVPGLPRRSSRAFGWATAAACALALVLGGAGILKVRSTDATATSRAAALPAPPPPAAQDVPPPPAAAAETAADNDVATPPSPPTLASSTAPAAVKARPATASPAAPASVAAAPARPSAIEPPSTAPSTSVGKLYEGQPF